MGREGRRPDGAPIQLKLVGGSGEPVDLWRSIQSHGLVDLPPMRIDDDARALEVTLPGSPRPRTVRVAAGRAGHAAVEVAGRKPSATEEKRILALVRLVLRLDEDLSPFYTRAAADPELAWVTGGAGRLVRNPTVFEEVVKTLCTTNCTWSATVRMVNALVSGLGEPAAGAPSEGPYGRAFPTPAAMAAAELGFYTDTVRAGYRGPYLQSLAASVATGELDLEILASEEISDEEAEARLLALPGIGPYAAAHVMMLLGRYHRLVLDSWTRPTYARLTGGRPKKDATIERRFRRYGPYAGLAFWTFVTQDWVE